MCLFYFTEIASDALKGRVFEVNLADLQKDEARAFRKVRLIAEDIQGTFLSFSSLSNFVILANKVLTNFHGMDLTTDKFRSLVRKWQSLIEAHVDVKTTDGYFLRMFAIAFTKRRPNQLKKTSYAQTSQVRAIRRKMMDIMTREASTVDLKDLVSKFIPESIGTQIEKECQGIYPLQNVFVRKVKLIKSPKFDPARLLELHGETTNTAAVAPAPAAATEDTGKKV